MRSSLLLLFFLAFLLAGCNNDDDGLGLANTLHYDGPNFTAPVLPAGDYEAAARFTEAELNAYVGQQITEVIFFYAGIPSATTLRIYGPGSDQEPGGSVLYQAGISGSLSPGSWNAHRVRSPVAVTGDDLWVSIGFTHNSNLQSIGCDAGPGHPDGQWLYSSDSGQWETFLDFAGEDINWNIRLRIE